MKPRIAVVGGGITGVFAAYFLTRSGAQVTIVERGQIGGQASGNNPGGLNPLHGPGIPGPMSELALASLRLHRDQWDELERVTGRAPEARPVSRLHVAMDEEEARALAEAEALHNRTPGFCARWLEPAEARRTEPWLSPEAAGGLWTQGNFRVPAGPYTRLVADAAVRLGAEIVTAEVRGLIGNSGYVSGLRLSAGDLPCDGAVLATGPWCQEPSRWLGLALPIDPVRGEMLLVSNQRASDDLDVTWGRFGVYTAPAGRCWLGGIEDRDGFDAKPSPVARERILDGINRMLPGLGRAEIIDQVAALRPTTPDGMPLLGIPDGWENVCVALGGGRKGVLLSSGLGLAAAELITRGTTELPIAACAFRAWELAA